MKRLITATAGMLALASAPTAAAGTLTLYPTGFGAMAFSHWQAQEGQPDSVGAANQALWLEKDLAEEGPTAAAVVSGLEGERVTVLTGLEWERRLDSDCTKSSPRWDLAIRGKSGKHYLVRFGCAQSAHLPGSAPGWVREVNSRTAIRARIIRMAGGTDALAGRIESLAIVFDDRGKTGRTVLDNIQVASTVDGIDVWTCAADNAATTVGPPLWAPAADPFVDDDFLTFDELWALLTAEQQELAASDVDPGA